MFGRRRRCRGDGCWRRARPIHLPLLLMRQFGYHLIDVGPRLSRCWRRRRRRRRSCSFSSSRGSSSSSSFGQLNSCHNFRFAIGVDDDGGNQLVIFEMLSTGHEPLQGRWVGITVAVDQERRRHQVRRQLRLLVQDVVVGVPDQRPVIRVEEHRLRKLLETLART